MNPETERSLQREIDRDRKSERRLVPQALAIVVIIAVLVVARIWFGS